MSTTINGVLDISQRIKGVISISGEPIVSGGTPYTGSYTVTPKANEQTVLQTQNKLLTNNVTVVQVPYWETSNESGYTAYIAQEVNE